MCQAGSGGRRTTHGSRDVGQTGLSDREHQPQSLLCRQDPFELDWYTKKIVGYDIYFVSRYARVVAFTSPGVWEAALDRALQAEFCDGVRGQGLRVVSDNGSQVTSTEFIKNMALLDIEQIFTSFNNPRGNAETERMIRTIKEEVLWLEEFAGFNEAKETISQWIEQDYNLLYPHSALGYCLPVEFETLLDYQATAA